MSKTKQPKSIYKSDLVQILFDKYEGEFTKKHMTEVIDTFLGAITDATVKGTDVRISGFGKFTKVHRAKRSGRNPQTGEKITIKAYDTPAFRPSSQYKKAVSK